MIRYGKEEILYINTSADPVRNSFYSPELLSVSKVKGLLKIEVAFFLDPPHHLAKSITFALFGLHRAYSERCDKRESGENPEQCPLL